MKHVTNMISTWLAGETTAEQAEQIERHLAACAECAAEAAQAGSLWQELAELESAQDLDAAPSAWLQVRARTVAGNRSHWFYGSNTLLRTGLAAGAVAAGLFVSAILPGGSGDDADKYVDQSIENIWLEDSSWTSTGGDQDLDAMWLDVGLDTEG